MGRRGPVHAVDAPGPEPAEMLRAVPILARDPLAYLERVVARYGDLVAFPMPRRPVLLVNDPAGARRVLQDAPGNYLKRTVQYAALAEVTGQGLLVSDGDVWRAHRRLVRPAFHREVSARCAAQAVRAGDELRRAWDAAGPARPLDADAAVMRGMLRLVGRTLLASDLDVEAARIVAAVDDALRLLVHRARSPVPAGWPTPSRWRLRRAVRVLDATCAALVASRRTAAPPERAPDLLGLLLAAADAAELTADEVRDELVTMVIAGYETVASALVWTLGLLADHPPVQRELAAELSTVLGGRHPTAADLGALRLTRAVVDESLRLYPPAWVITRVAAGPDELVGVRIPARTLVILSPWLLHRRAADWPEPTRFDPRRFVAAAGAGGTDRRDPAPAAVRSAAPCATYLPFGLGPRLCIGRDLALVEAVLVLATLLRDRWVARPPGALPPRPKALVTLRPRGGQPLLLTRDQQ
ncbi:MAG TPA: cytochrome P450 [Kineosporiaceae bacterium]